MDLDYRNPNTSLIWKSIISTPDVLEEVLGTEQDVSQLAQELARREIRKIFFTGCGSSNFLGIAGECLLHQIALMPSLALPAFELYNYGPPDLSDATAVVAFSHSGATKTTIDAAKFAKDKGAYVIAATNSIDSPLAELSDHVALIPGREVLSPERGVLVPLTRGYSSALMFTILFALELGKALKRQEPGVVSRLRSQLDEVPELVGRIVADADPIAQLAERYKGYVFYVAGGGPNYATALEAAVEMKEISNTRAEAFEIEEIAHGPIATVPGEDTVVLVVAPPGKSHDRAMDMVKAAKVMGAFTVAEVSERDTEFPKIANELIRVPGELDEVLTPMLYVIPLQMLAYNIGVKKGVHVDSVKARGPKYRDTLLTVFPPGTH